MIFRDFKILRRFCPQAIDSIVEERDWKRMRGTQYNFGPSVSRLRPRNAVAVTEARHLFRRTEKCLGLRDIAQGYAS